MELSDSLYRLEKHVRELDYAGYSKFDALNSPTLEILFGFSPLTRLLVVQTINRVPLPLRELFKVRRGRNPKGIANFIKGYCARFDLTGDKRELDKGRTLAQWLLDNHAAAHGAFKGEGMGWGYNFPWQSPGFFARRFAPNCIVTVFCGEALLAIYLRSREMKFLDAARQVARFILRDLPLLEENQEKKCIGYVREGLKWRVININAVAAGFLSKLALVTSEEALFNEAKKMIQWVMSVRTPEKTWNYTDPKSQSGIGPDNYHTGGILDGIYDYMQAAKDEEHRTEFLASLEVYRAKFFTAEGAPRWRLDRDYPQDIHGAAQGILTFAKASTWQPAWLDQAELILRWAIKKMQDPRGHFYYQRFSHFVWKLELMRWNNSWMFWAMCEFERTRAQAKVRNAA